MDATALDLFERMKYIVRSRGMNLSPFSRIDNGTEVYKKWDMNSNEAFAARDAYHKVRNDETRKWNDKPCTPYFGGSLCAKLDKDGNMIIET